MDTEHVYERVTTTFKDKDGNLITVDKDNNPVESTEEGENQLNLSQDTNS